MNSSSSPLLATHGLCFSFGKRPILHDVNLRVEPGSIYGFLGPNGAGKSTTMRLLLGLLRPAAGSVQLFGHDLARHRVALLGRVGALIENPSLYDHLTGHENVEATRRLRGVAAHRTAEVLALVGLTDNAHRPAREYSLGMRQRLGLAIALLSDPDLLLLDEPTNGLDPNGIIEMRELMRRLRQEQGKTIVVSSHLINEIEKVATHVGVIQQGRLVFQGSLPDLQRLQTGRTRLVLETQDADTCRNLLPRLLAGATPAGPGTLWLPWVSREHTAEVAAAVTAAGLPLYGLHLEQPSLEDTFLHLTEARPTLA
ncbi:ABC-2 type transport system ATP-binding protein [Hymenobacter luteus]|uniref:ABC-2 type transport system ATP-binding protein n=2 Tax=Hymenobacter TaxID=89966 RepID=A0A7W9W9K7_9BACT|nr:MULTISPECIES: ABC transporter ATP-binding protein [Hymenobacter]MBB4599931.1 ABC-2 type transport system ATP-binding protein [Hymenobacter latericoloratus]MBB6057759.1 ABC-2 type transport system ATP-binding protein [Hymenobacter luteus]